MLAMPPPPRTPNVGGVAAVSPPRPSDDGSTHAPLLHLSVPKTLSEPPEDELMSMPPPSVVSEVVSIVPPDDAGFRALSSSVSVPPPLMHLSVASPGSIPPIDDRASFRPPSASVPPLLYLSVPHGESVPPADEVDALPPASGAHAGGTVAGLAEAVEAIKTAATRDEIGDAIVGFLAGWFTTAIVFAIRGDNAVGWKGYSWTDDGAIDPTTFASLTLPLGPASMFREAFKERVRVKRRGRLDTIAMHARVFSHVHSVVPHEMVVAPIVLGERVQHLICVYTNDEAPIAKETLAALDALAKAAKIAIAAINRKGL
jgi:hypothetical protein